MMDFGKPEYDNVPPLIKESLEAWVKHGRPPGHFVAAVLRNDLHEAFCRADEQSTAAMRDIVMMMRWEVPGDAWGSKEKMVEWQNALQVLKASV